MTGTVTYFGKAHTGAVYYLAEPIETPVGSICLYCEELIVADDDGFRDAGFNIFHRECFTRMIIGSVAHMKGTCGCWDSKTATCDDAEEAIGKREGARRALKYAQDQKSRRTVWTG